MSRPQYPKSCGISSLVSCWNFLYSTLGAGTKQPISTEEALEVLGFKPPYNGVSFGSFTGNDTLILWFSLLNRYYGVTGQARISFKLHGKGKMVGIDSETALKDIQTGLQDEKKAYIYHCYNHYMCPIGFESTPTFQHDAYKPNEEISEFKHWIIIGEISRMYPSFHIKQWEDIYTDIDCAFPRFMNIRKSEEGVQMKTAKQFTEGKSLGGNLHCFIEFERTDKPQKVSEADQEEIRVGGDGGGKYRKFVANNYSKNEQPSQEEVKQPLQESQMLNQQPEGKTEELEQQPVVRAELETPVQKNEIKPEDPVKEQMREEGLMKVLRESEIPK